MLWVDPFTGYWVGWQGCGQFAFGATSLKWLASVISDYYIINLAPPNSRWDMKGTKLVSKHISRMYQTKKQFPLRFLEIEAFVGSIIGNGNCCSHINFGIVLITAGQPVGPRQVWTILQRPTRWNRRPRHSHEICISRYCELWKVGGWRKQSRV